MGIVGFVTSTTSSMLASKVSLEATLREAGGMAPTDDERVTILVARTLFCGSTLMMKSLPL